MSAVITFNPAAFRTNPAFAAFKDLPDATLNMYWQTATNFISPCKYGWMNCSSRTLALNLLTAHLAAISDIISTGNVPQVVKGATIDKVSVTLEPPPGENEWQWWLNTTPYGQQCLALLLNKAAGGIYVTPRNNGCYNRGW